MVSPEPQKVGEMAKYNPENSRMEKGEGTDPFGVGRGHMIPKLMAVQAEEIGLLRDALSELEDSLGPILGPDSDNNKVAMGSEDSVEMSEHARIIDDHNDRIRSMRHRVMSIQHRLEI